MKTNQVMLRPMGRFQVVQRTSDGYFDGADLLYQWRKSNPKCKDTVKDFIEQTKVQTFLSELEKEIGNDAQPQKWGMADLHSVVVNKGRNTKNGRSKDQVWMHPYLFIKFSMWLNPRFEVQVIKFVYDQMIQYRNEAGDAYRELSAAVATIVPKSEMKSKMRKIGEALNWVIFNAHEKMLRNKQGDEDKQKELWMFEKKVATLINEGFIKNYKHLIAYLRNQYAVRNWPKVLDNE